MLDQSFSVENFRYILDIENRKGIHLEEKLLITSVSDINHKIRECSRKINEAKKRRDANGVRQFIIAKKDLRKQKESQLQIELEKISKSITDKSFKIGISKINIPSRKPIYTIEKDANSFFALKQLQRNISKLYKVKQANRNLIISQVNAILSDNFPKYVIRTDISSFYENIDQGYLRKKLNENLLTPLSRKLILDVLRDYNLISGAKKGVPRGIGISAYLSEIYARDIDKRIQSLRSVSYYARYVDDIIIIFTPDNSDEKRDFKTEVKNIIQEEFGLQINQNKTESFDTRTTSNFNCEFLGYKISFGNNFEVSISSNKNRKYKDRIDKTFKEYENLSKVKSKLARQYLIKRVRYLTTNTRLLNNKKNIMVGIYYSNKFVTNTKVFKKLDRYLGSKIDSSTCNPKLKSFLKKYSFENGFNSKDYSPFKIHELKEINRIW